MTRPSLLGEASGLSHGPTSTTPTSISSLDNDSSTSLASSNTSTPSSSSTPPWSQTPSSSLEAHVNQAYYSYQNQSPKSFFRKDPLLQKSRRNRILCYYGCFNPPHVAHLNLLRHIYNRAKDQFNIIAAIIYPLADDKCRVKLARGDGYAHLLSHGERVRLWEKDPEFPEWACVLGDDMSEGFWDALQVGVGKEGFDVSIVSVIGTDYANCERGVYDYGEEVMLSDAGRVADFVTERGLLMLPGCTPWCVLSESKESSRGGFARSKPLWNRDKKWKESKAFARGYLADNPECPDPFKSEELTRRHLADYHYRDGYEAVAKLEGVPKDITVKSQDDVEGYTNGLKTVQDDSFLDNGYNWLPCVLDAKSSNLYNFDPNEIYSCRRSDKEDRIIFIPSSEDSVYRKYTSSTEIREMMSKNPSDPKKITKEMASVVLGPHRKIMSAASTAPNRTIGLPKLETRAERISKNLYETSIFG